MLSPKLFSHILLTAVVAATWAIQYAYAQEAKPPLRRPPISRTPHPTTEFDTVELKEAPAMPLLPAYTGKGMKFESANTCPNFRFGTSYTVRFKLKEPPEVVRDWYVGALGASGWQVQNDQMSRTNIVAMHTKQKASCGIMVQPLSKLQPTYKTLLMIQYQESK